MSPRCGGSYHHNEQNLCGNPAVFAVGPEPAPRDHEWQGACGQHLAQVVKSQGSAYGPRLLIVILKVEDTK
jgi:hypothetical protein